MSTTQDRLRQAARFTRLDADRELLTEAADALDRREAVIRLLEGEVAATTQPAEVTLDEVMQAAKKATAPEWQDVIDGWHMGLDLMAFARAILALRPVQVPMTDGYGDDDCGWTFAIGRELEAQEKRLMSLLVKAFGSHHPAIDDMAHLILTRSAHHGITAQADLWCIHIPGPDEVHAAPSKEAADHMAAKHNAAMATFYSSGAPNLEFAPSIENVQAVAIKWPYDQQSHADELREFDYASWGITTQAKKETP